MDDLDRKIAQSFEAEPTTGGYEPTGTSLQCGVSPLGHWKWHGPHGAYRDSVASWRPVSRYEPWVVLKCLEWLIEDAAWDGISFMSVKPLGVRCRVGSTEGRGKLPDAIIAAYGKARNLA